MNAIEVLVPGLPVPSHSAFACASAPARPRMKLPLVQAQRMASTFSVSSRRADSRICSVRAVCSSASTAWSSPAGMRDPARKTWKPCDSAKR